jgi:hypothetical protein
MRKTTADQHLHGALHVSRILPEVLCVPVEYRQREYQTGCSPGNSPICGNPSNTGATLSRTPLLQRAVELHRRSLILSCCPPQPSLVEMALRRGAPVVYFHHAGKIALREVLLLEIQA